MGDRCEYSVYDDNDIDGPAWRCHNSASVFYVQMVTVDARGSVAYETHAVCENHRTIADSCHIGAKVSESEYSVHVLMGS